jgi:hypothetical protein
VKAKAKALAKAKAPLVKEQIERAGVRLAAVLNAALH